MSAPKRRLSSEEVTLAWIREAAKLEVRAKAAEAEVARLRAGLQARHRLRFQEGNYWRVNGQDGRAQDAEAEVTWLRRLVAAERMAK